MTVSKTSKEFKEIFDSIKSTIVDNGRCTTEEFKELVGDAEPIDMITTLQEEGIVYVKTPHYGEVLVDIRLMVAGMLIAYSHPNYATTNLVLDYLKNVFDVYPAYNMHVYAERNDLLELAYVHLGHNYTLSKVADRAAINFAHSDSNAYDLFERSETVLRMLSQDDFELTAVYRLAKNAFDIANGWSNGSVYGMKRKDQDPNSTFNHFHKLASKMINKHRPHK